jgi:hypothetical protein
MQGKRLLAAAMLAIGGANVASADVLWSNTGSGIEGIDVFSSEIQSPLLEDGIFAGDPGPYNVTGIRLGYDNTGDLPVSSDVLVSFWDTVNYNIIDSTPIASSQIGTTFRFNFLAQPGAGDTGLLNLPGGPLLFPDSDFGVMVNFVAPNTSTAMAGINHLFKDVPVSVGTSDNFFAYDWDFNGVVDGTEVFQWQSGPFAHANLYMEIQGAAAVPEPGSAMLLAGAGLSLLRRRRA